MKRSYDSKELHEDSRNDTGSFGGFGRRCRLKFWLYKNYQIIPDESKSQGGTSSKDIYQHFVNTQEGNTTTIELGRVVKSLFNGLEVEMQENISREERVTVYTNLSRRLMYPETNAETYSPDIIYYDWIFRGYEDDLAVFSKLSEIQCNGTEYVLKLVISKDLSFFYISGHEGSRLSSKELEYQKGDLPSMALILQYLNTFHLCTGFIEDQHANAIINSDMDDSTCVRQTIKHGNETEVKKVVSHQCRLLVEKENQNCSSCSRLQHNIKRRKTSHECSVASKVPYKHLNREELKEKLGSEKAMIKNAKSREKYWKDKYSSFEKECLEVDDKDDKDFESMLKEVDCNKVSEEMKLLIEEQIRFSKKPSKGYRWHPKVMRLCLDVYSTSPKAFDTLKKHLILPSSRTIRYYKNAVPMSSGWEPEVMLWLHNEADSLNLAESDRWCGLVFDEMTIQEDLEFVKVNGKNKIVGAVNLGKMYKDMRILTKGPDHEIELAKKVMQFALVTDNGFRFVLAHFPVATMPAEALEEKFWEGVEACHNAGFWVYWVLCDGGEPNRSFMKMLFGGNDGDPVKDKFVAFHIYTGKEMVVMADPKHNFKKLRNNISKSSNYPKSARYLKNHGRPILFSHWKDAFEWDIKTHSMPLHERLTDGHFNLDASSKMRNQLAEDVLDSKMLFLMKEYRNSLLRAGKKHKADELLESIELLKYTSELISLFHSKHVIENAMDTRIQRAKDFLQYMQEWKGLEQVVKVKQASFPNSKTRPVILNQDVLENVFCQVRGSNGQNDHPKAYLYSSTIRSINFGQTVLSRKGNTSGDKEALPQSNLPIAHPFQQKGVKRV